MRVDPCTPAALREGRRKRPLTLVAELDEAGVRMEGVACPLRVLSVVAGDWPLHGDWIVDGGVFVPAARHWALSARALSDVIAPGSRRGVEWDARRAVGSVMEVSAAAVAAAAEHADRLLRQAHARRQEAGSA